jgi:hypothetical protein
MVGGEAGKRGGGEGSGSAGKRGCEKGEADRSSTRAGKIETRVLNLAPRLLHRSDCLLFPASPLSCFPAYWYWIYTGLGYSSRTSSGFIIGLSFL